MLTREQIGFFENEGYLVVEDVVDQKTVLEPVRAEYAALLDRLYDAWHAQGRVPAANGMSFDDKLLVAYKAGCDWFQPMDISLPGDAVAAATPFHFGPAVFDMLTNDRLLDMVEALIGPEITSNPIQHVRIKPPATDLRDGETRAHITRTDWHQDLGVTLDTADDTRMITVWIAVSDATEDNGCLKVIPGAHRSGMLPHCTKIQVGIPDAYVQESQAVPLPVKSGGVVIFHPLVPHASMVNHTDGFRWSFDIRYNVSGHPTGREHFPDFVARSRRDPTSALRDPAEWLRMWQDARARLSAAKHVSLYRWDDSAPYCA